MWRTKHVINQPIPTMLQLKFRKQAALAAMLFVVNELSRRSIRADFIKVFKILYFADQAHLVKYGRSITGDTYVAMDFGPVPSQLYDMIKAVRGDSFFHEEGSKYKEMFTVENRYEIKPQDVPNMDNLSATDLRELNTSINSYAPIDSITLSQQSHGPAWCKADKDRYMDAANIMREAGANEDMINHVSEMISFEKALNDGVPASC